VSNFGNRFKGISAALFTKMIPTILLTGKNGQIGRELSTMLARIGNVTALGRHELDLTKPDDIRDVIRSVHPQLIVNAAAYTAVDRAESEESLAGAINERAPGVMAEEAKKTGAFLVHYSTDYVFDGLKLSPYTEHDVPNPQCVYGKTKLGGERAIEQSGANFLIFRTAWVYAREGHNFLLTILRLAAQREELKIVRDQIGAPTWSHEIAKTTTRILAQCLVRAGNLDALLAVKGLYHMTAAGEASWFHFTESILEEARTIAPDTLWYCAATRNLPLVARRVVPITTAEFPTPARRPAYSVLSNSRLTQTFQTHLPDWRAQLHSVFGVAPSPRLQ
jgi:dTDP-4-dehydrorhamnose reductase